MNELEDHTPYDMKITGEIFVQAKVLGIDLEELVEFFATQVEAMLRCPPNFKYEGNRCWVLRGFYPGTSLFFKQIVLHVTRDRLGESSGYYFSKVTPFTVSFRKRSPSHETFKGSDLREMLTNKMENSLLGAKHAIKPIVTVNVKMPRCISPKGMKLFRYDKPKR